jgi:hypothetical protein
MANKAENIDDLSVDWTDDDGTQITKQLDKVVLSKGAWVTIMYLYQDLDRKTNSFGESKVRIERYQKKDGVYRSQSKFNISSANQAKQISDSLGKWFPKE